MKNLKRKLSSGKFWAAVAAWITSLLAAFNVAEGTTAQIVLIVSGLGSLVAYMFAEAIVDAKRCENDGENEIKLELEYDEKEND